MTKPPVNFIVSLMPLLEKASNEDVKEWAAHFDWLMPITSSVVAGTELVAVKSSALDIFISQGSPRLLELILRQDMFDINLGGRLTSNSERGGSTLYRESFSKSGLWRSAWLSAIAKGDIELIKRIQTYGGDDAFPPRNKFSSWFEGATSHITSALSDCPKKSRYEFLTYFFEDPDSVLFKGVFDDGERKRLCDQFLKFIVTGSSEKAVIKDVLAAFPKKIRVDVFEALIKSDYNVDGKRLGVAIDLLEFIFKNGGFYNQRTDGTIRVDRDENNRGYRSSISDVSPLTLIIDGLCRPNSNITDASFRRIAHRVLAWPADGVFLPAPGSVTKILSRKATQWDTEGRLSEAVRDFNKSVDPEELSNMMIMGTDDAFAKRFQDFLEDNPTLEKWEIFAAHFGKKIELKGDIKNGIVNRERQKVIDASLVLAGRLGFIASQLPSELAENVDNALRSGLLVRYTEDPELGKRAVAFYDYTRLDMSSSNVTGNNKKIGIRL